MAESADHRPVSRFSTPDSADLEPGGEIAPRERNPDTTEEGADRKPKGKLKKSKRRQKRRPPPPGYKIFQGTFVHSTWEEPLVILRETVVGVHNGKIIFVDSARRLDAILEKLGLSEWKERLVLRMSDRTFMVPGFVDAHAHGIQFLSLGTGMDGGMDDDANGLKARRQAKLKAIHDDRTARLIYRKMLLRSLRNGTTCAAYHGSGVESGAQLLAEMAARTGQRALVGLEYRKDEQRDDVHLLQSVLMKDTVDYIFRLQNPLVQPYLIMSKPLPDWLEHKSAELKARTGIFFKTNQGDVPDHVLRGQCWFDYGQSALRYRNRNRLLDDKTLLVYCNHLTADDIKLIRQKQASVVHCPYSDFRSPNHVCNIRNLLSKGIKVALGTDIQHGHSVSMLEAMRNSMTALQIRKASQRERPTPEPKKEVHQNGTAKQREEGEGGEEEEEEEEEEEIEGHVSLREVFRIATLGGAHVLGLEDVIGNFTEGKEFDAVLVDPAAPGTPIDIFVQDSFEDILEKFVCLGDDRNISHVYVKGEQLI